MGLFAGLERPTAPRKPAGLFTPTSSHARADQRHFSGSGAHAYRIE
ncbi:hypothetical protein AB0I46_39385 [Streptomyces spectabilis]